MEVLKRIFYLFQVRRLLVLISVGVLVHEHNVAECDLHELSCFLVLLIVADLLHYEVVCLALCWC